MDVGEWIWILRWTHYALERKLTIYWETELISAMKWTIKNLSFANKHSRELWTKRQFSQY